MAEPVTLYRKLTGDSQLRWVGPEKGVIHLAAAAVINAVWDLWARLQSKPVWQVVCDMSPEQFASCVDFRYLTDALTKVAGRRIAGSFLRQVVVIALKSYMPLAIPATPHRPDGSDTRTKPCEKNART